MGSSSSRPAIVTRITGPCPSNLSDIADSIVAFDGNCLRFSQWRQKILIEYESTRYSVVPSIIMTLTPTLTPHTYTCGDHIVHVLPRYIVIDYGSGHQHEMTIYVSQDLI